MTDLETLLAMLVRATVSHSRYEHSDEIEIGEYSDKILFRFFPDGSLKDVDIDYEPRSDPYD